MRIEIEGETDKPLRQTSVMIVYVCLFVCLFVCVSIYTYSWNANHDMVGHHIKHISDINKS